MDGAVIGLPRSLLYHKYGTLWTTFFESIGCSTVVSPPTNKAILEVGTSLAVDESCLPVKVHLGHVWSLRDKADAVLVPRVVTLAKREEACINLLGMYDVVRNALPEVNVVQYTVDVRRGVRERPEMCRLGRTFCRDPGRVRRAYREAKHAQAEHEAELAARQYEALVIDPAKPRVLAVGHTYNLADELIGKPILKLLDEQGVTVISSEWIDKRQARVLAGGVSDRVKWTYNKELLGAIQTYRDGVDGIVVVVTFPCGPDSLVAELCRHRVTDVPLITLVLDELQAEGGLRTRLESFADIIKARKCA